MNDSESPKSKRIKKTLESRLTDIDSRIAPGGHPNSPSDGHFKILQ
jgi:hypothetical protein